MDAEWHRRANELFLAARAQRPEQRRDYLDRECREDAELRREVDSLLIAHDRRGDDDSAFPTRSERVAPPVSDRSTDDTLVGGTLGRYRILGLVGKGGMGTVYEAEDPELRRKVALKVLPATLASDREGLERFKREARSAAALSHPNIVTIYSVEAAPSPDGGDDIHFLTMELVQGEPMDRLIPEKGLALGEILSRATQLADGLQAAHDQGIVHRDLKPANVIVDREDRIRILDFGLAKPQATENENSQAETSLALTSRGAVLGTVPYMSPEQVAGKPLDSRSDIFSLGAMLYEMCTGRRPFTGESFSHVVSAILRDEPTPTTQLRSDLPSGLERVVKRCLAKEPSKRYQSARELRDALEELDRQTPSTRRLTGIQWIGVTATLIALVLVGVGVVSSVRDRKPPDEAPAATVPARTMIVVLPFENLGRPEDAYFAAGMTEEISARLASVSELGVIANNSARQYAGSEKTARQIGEELGAAYLVMGSVRWSGEAAGSSRIRVTPRIINAADDTQIWADTFDREFVDVFEIQSEIAAAVVDLLDVTLLETERQVLENRPTQNFEAYKAFLKAQDWVRERVSDDTLRHSGQQLQRAVELDPEFVEAWRALTVVHARLFSFRYDHTAARRLLAHEAMSRTESLAPGSVWAHTAKGVYAYHVERNYDLAWKEFTEAQRLQAGTGVEGWTGALLQRLGRWQESAAVWRHQATVLDPRSGYLWDRLGEVNSYLGEYDEAVRCFEIAIELDPTFVGPHVHKGIVSWLRDGDVDAARQAFAEAPDVPLSSNTKALLFWQEIFEGHYQGALDYLAGLPEPVLGAPIYFRPKALHEGVAQSLLGERAAARTSFEAAAAQLEEALRSAPDNEKLHSALGVAYAALGRREEAVREGQRAVELVPLETDPWFGLVHVEDLAWIFTLLGERDQALAQLERLLSVPSMITIPYLELDPRWKTLREHPRFEELKASYGSPRNR